MISSMRAWCPLTPSTSSTAYAGTGGSARATRSPSVATGSVCRRSLSYSRSSARFLALLRAVTGRSVDPAEVPAVAGVDLDLLAGRQEQRDLDLGTGLQPGRLGAARGPVALQARLGVRDHQLDAGRQLHVQRVALVQADHHRGVLQQVVGPVP